MDKTRWDRRDFLRLSGQAVGAVGLGGAYDAFAADGLNQVPCGSHPATVAKFNGIYAGDRLNQIAFPMGGIGAGMICLEGTGALSKLSLRNEPDLMNAPGFFAALSLNRRRDAAAGNAANLAKVIEGPVPRRKAFPEFSVDYYVKVRSMWGLPRFRSATFEAAFPFGVVTLRDDEFPVDARITGWSPFEPGDEDSASLPVAAVEYEFTNRAASTIDAVFSFNVENFIADAVGRIRPLTRGFVIDTEIGEKPWTKGGFAISVDDPSVKVNHSWSRGAWLDVVEGTCIERPPAEGDARASGASLFVPLSLVPGESKTVVVRFAWYVAGSNLNLPGGRADDKWMWDHATRVLEAGKEYYSPWYAGKFADAEQVMDHWSNRYQDLRERSRKFSDALHNSTVPREIIEAVAANLAILKSPTVLRQQDGRLWGWEGSAETFGSWEGSCTHVWNYAQAVAHLFPGLERTLRETEFGPNQNADGHQDFRSAIPIRSTPHNFLAAVDGQLGGVMKAYRDWRISGDTQWIRRLWPRIRESLDYCIRTWDPRHRGWIEEPAHNTYDIEFWGPNGMATSFYLGALQAAVLIGKALHNPVDDYASLLRTGVRRMEAELFNGEFFIQKVQWQGLNAKFPEDTQKGLGGKRTFTAEELEIAAREGPAAQYGSGCLSDGVLGVWLAWACGLMQLPLDPSKVGSHLRSVYRYNFKPNLATFASPVTALRASFALGDEGGTVLCSWPHDNAPTMPFAYATEVWTGVEYQVASHLISMGEVQSGLDIVRACRRRYDGTRRNPFNEIEAGHWYARAMSSYALLQAYSGARFDAVDKILYLKPAVAGDFRCFLSTATGFGTVGVRNGQPFVEVAAGAIPYTKIDYMPVEPA